MFSSRFDNRDSSNGRGGTLGTINWFQGDALFLRINYHYGDRITASAEYTADIMFRESSYLDIKSPWEFGLSYLLNDYLSLSTQYLYGKQIVLKVTAHVSINPSRPPMLGGKRLAPVPMRLRGSDALHRSSE